MRFKQSWPVFVLWAVTFVAALGTGHDLFYKLAYFLSALIVISVLWAWLNVSGVRLERQARSTRSQVGKPFEERFTVNNTFLLPKLWLELEDGSDLPGHQVSRVVSALGGRSSHSWTVRTNCWWRGKFTLGPIVMTSSDPFGLFEMRRFFPSRSTVIVYPATVELPHFAPSVGQLLGGSIVHRRTHYITPNVSTVRDYAPGDGFNRIHWPSTARTGRLIVKEFELDPTADVWICLDMDAEVQAGRPWALPAYFQRRAQWRDSALFWADAPPSKMEPLTEEYGVTIAASVARRFLARELSVGLIAYGRRREIIQSDRGERQLLKILEALALVRAEGRTPLAEVLAAESARFGRHVTLVVVTPSAGKDWVLALRNLERRGVRTIAVLLMVNTFAAVRAPQEVQTELAASAITTYLVKRGQPLELALSQPAW